MELMQTCMEIKDINSNIMKITNLIIKDFSYISNINFFNNKVAPKAREFSVGFAEQNYSRINK